MKHIPFLALIISLFVSDFSTAQTAVKNNPKHHLVIQLTSADTQVHKGLMKQLNNLTTGFGDKIEIEVVCHGPGIFMLHNDRSIVSTKISKMKSKGVVFVACENTMIAKNIEKEDLLDNLEFVKMGIGEIIFKQEQGWSYVKAGF